MRNKICRLEFDLSNDQLAFFENLVSNELLGVTVEQLSPEMIQQLALALGSYTLSLSPLLYAVYELSDEISQRHVEMRGEGNLLRYSDFDANELIAFLNTKNEISKILSSAFDGIRVVFGKEEETFSITNSSLIFSKYGASHSAGSFGILGPIRLDYACLLYTSVFLAIVVLFNVAASAVINHYDLSIDATSSRIFQLSSQTEEFLPVSYTHLDVYKRQTWLRGLPTAHRLSHPHPPYNNTPAGPA